MYTITHNILWYTRAMPLYITATYQIKKEAVKKVKKAIEEFTAYIKKNEKGTRVYMVWQDKEDPTKFIHFFIFADEEAHITHSNSEAVKKFEKVYVPSLVHGPVVFKHYEEVASKNA